ncbi:HEPN family nuclease [Anaerotignum propionicum]|uniref:HEPN family nuclease n=1 Tax=Anaerotignum propionicum TaxID=28446 RepID=UPI00289807B4|nr:HEPN family nuclease [Anaerotignum propionicum]
MNKKVSITDEENLIFQSYSIIKFLFELNSKNFTNSDYYKDEFTNPNDLFKYYIDNVGIINQGTIIFALYSMLVLTKELLFDSLKMEFSDFNLFLLNESSSSCHSTYKSDKKEVNVIRHIRNAVAHGKISICKNGSIMFVDKNNNEEFHIELSFDTLEKFINELQNLISKIYMKKLY